MPFKKNTKHRDVVFVKAIMLFCFGVIAGTLVSGVALMTTMSSSEEVPGEISAPAPKSLPSKTAPAPSGDQDLASIVDALKNADNVSGGWANTCADLEKAPNPFKDNDITVQTAVDKDKKIDPDGDKSILKTFIVEERCDKPSSSNNLTITADTITESFCLTQSQMKSIESSGALTGTTSGDLLNGILATCEKNRSNPQTATLNCNAYIVLTDSCPATSHCTGNSYNGFCTFSQTITTPDDPVEEPEDDDKDIPDDPRNDEETSTNPNSPYCANITDPGTSSQEGCTSPDCGFYGNPYIAGHVKVEGRDTYDTCVSEKSPNQWIVSEVECWVKGKDLVYTASKNTIAVPEGMTCKDGYIQNK